MYAVLSILVSHIKFCLKFGSSSSSILVLSYIGALLETICLQLFKFRNSS